MQKDRLSILRKKIDSIDSRILKLLTDRALLAIKIGREKKFTGQEYYLPYREKEIITKLIKSNRGPLSNEAIENIFFEILHSCRALQKKLTVAYLGPEASFTHLAAMKNFGSYVDFISMKTISDVFDEVEKKRVNYGVVPVENSTEGMINHTLDMFLESDLKIYSEINLPIIHCLLSKSGNMKMVKKVYSHPQALAQCRNWLETNLPEVKIIETGSTSEAAILAIEDKSGAAISSELAGKLYSLKIIVKGIQDLKENYTRFLVIGNEFSSKRSGNDKTSILLSIKDKVGALYEILSFFKRYNVNLTKIESRPTKKKVWEYVFFIDFNGHISEPAVKKVLDGIKSKCVFVKILGSYPKAE